MTKLFDKMRKLNQSPIGPEVSTEGKKPTEQEIANATETFKEEYLRHEEECMKAALEINELMGAGKAFHVNKLKRVSNGKYTERTMKVLKKIGLCGREKENWRMVFDRGLRLKFIEGQMDLLQQLQGEYKFHEGALLDYESGKRAAERKKEQPSQEPIELKKVD